MFIRHLLESVNWYHVTSVFVAPSLKLQTCVCNILNNWVRFATLWSANFERPWDPGFRSVRDATPKVIILGPHNYMAKLSKQYERQNTFCSLLNIASLLVKPLRHKVENTFCNSSRVQETMSLDYFCATNNCYFLICLESCFIP